ncbi:MAG: heme-binding protein, partial [Actinomycetes bacterium]
VLAEETDIDWFAKHGVEEEQYAIHGGGLPISVAGKGLVGILLISGMPQVQDHLLGVEVLTEYLARKGEMA